MVLTIVLTVRSEQNVCVDNDKEDGVDGGDKHLARSEQNMYDDDSNGDSADSSVDGGVKYLTHLTQLENNVDLYGCYMHLTHVVENKSESLISDITGH
eukprot:14946216-Ditylum_brightwellii.AAC.1